MDESLAVKVNLEFHKKSSISLLIIITSLLFIICVIVASAASPSILGESSLLYTACEIDQTPSCYYQDTEINSFLFGVVLEDYNQFLFLWTEFTSKNDLNTALNYSLEIYSKSYNETDILKRSNETFSINCENNKCDSALLFYLPYIKHSNYTVRLKTFGQIKVDSLRFSIKFITKEFTKFFLGVKYFFLATSIINIALFAYGLFKVSVRFWSYHTKLLILVSISLFVFNEPFLYFSLKELTPEWSGVSVVSNSQFASMMILFWFFVLHHDFQFKNWLISVVIESVLVFIFFVLVNVVYVFTTVNLKFDPTFSWEQELPKEKKGVYIAAITFLVVFSVWMIVLIIYSLTRIRAKTAREKVMTGSVIIMMVITAVLIGIGAFQPLPRSGTLLLITLSLYNLYFYVMFWLYTPSHLSYNQFLVDEIKKIGEEIKDPETTFNDGKLPKNKI